MAASYFLGREHILPEGDPSMSQWRGQLFAFLSRNALGATTDFHLPADRVVEIGAQVRV